MNIKKIIANNPFTKKLVTQKSKNDIHNYWKNPDDAQYNSPQIYLNSKTKNTQILVDTVNQYFNDKNIKILELGCNVGRNLNKLFESGFQNLNGIEINPEAIQLMKTSFSEILSHVNISQGTIEENVKNFSDKEFDLVFSMAVLMHVHYDSDWIFEHLVRITKKHLITMEHEEGVARKNFPRNYKNIFEKLGLKQIDFFKLEKGYVCRIFELKK